MISLAKYACILEVIFSLKLSFSLCTCFLVKIEVQTVIFPTRKALSWIFGKVVVLGEHLE